MNDQSFWRAHASVLFTGSTFVFSLLLLIGAILLEDPTKPQFLPTFLSHLAAMGIAASVAAVFFNFRDMREVLATSISALLTDGDITRHLAPFARTRFRHRIVLQDLETKVDSLPPGVLAHIDRVALHCFTMPHLSNYATTIVLADSDLPGLLRRHYRCTYSIDCRHLKGGRGVYPLRVRHELTDPSARLSSDLLRQFDVRIGEQKFGIADAKVTQRTSAGTAVTLISFDRDIDIDGEATIQIASETLVDSSDPTEIIYAWYPMKGCRATLLYKEGFTYDVAWFKSWIEVAKNYPGREQVEIMPNGITAYTNDWLLPGHGATLVWFKLGVPR